MNSTLKLAEKEYPKSINDFIAFTGVQYINQLLNIDDITLINYINLYMVKYGIQYTYSGNYLLIISNGNNKIFVDTCKYQISVPLAGDCILIRISKIIVMPTFNILDIFKTILFFILENLEYPVTKVEPIIITNEEITNDEELPF